MGIWSPPSPKLFGDPTAAERTCFPEAIPSQAVRTFLLVDDEMQNVGRGHKDI